MSRLDLTPYTRYHIRPEVLDRMPIGTFLITSQQHSCDTPPTVAMRLVAPNDVSKYPAISRAPKGRLLYHFWSSALGGKKSLGQASVTKTWRWIVQPDDAGYDMLDAFKIACDHRRGQQVSTDLLHRALGFDTAFSPANITE